MGDVAYGPFLNATSYCFKAKLNAKQLIFYHHANKTYFHKNDFAFDLVLKVFGNLKWPILRA